MILLSLFLHAVLIVGAWALILIAATGVLYGIAQIAAQVIMDISDWRHRRVTRLERVLSDHLNAEAERVTWPEDCQCTVYAEDGRVTWITCGTCRPAGRHHPPVSVITATSKQIDQWRREL